MRCVTDSFVRVQPTRRSRASLRLLSLAHGDPDAR
jgi:hypothetical protein